MSEVQGKQSLETSPSDQQKEQGMDTPNKPKTIATIDVNIQWPTPAKRDWLEETLQDHLQCVLCGTDLEFSHKADFITQTVVEDAHCPGCKVRNRQSSHSLQ
jgi:hypothetical protein